MTQDPPHFTHDPLQFSLYSKQPTPTSFFEFEQTPSFLPCDNVGETLGPRSLSSFRPLVAMGTKFPRPWALFRSHVFDVSHTSQTVTRGQVQFQFFFNLPFLCLMFITITLILKYCSSSRFKEGENYESSFNFEYLKGWLQASIFSAGVNYITHLRFCLFTIRI